MKRRIEVVAYDDSWPVRFETEASQLTAVFKPDLVKIHHIGSTSVPGLAAKPTIDILIEVQPDTIIPDYYNTMQQLGYQCRGESLDARIPGTPGRFYFPKVVDTVHLTHVHVCHAGHPQIVELMALRDYLRTHPQEAEAYSTLKTKLAAEFTYDNHGYMQGKDALIKGMIEKAMQWRVSSSGTS